MAMQNSMENILSITLSPEPNTREELKSLIETVQHHDDYDVVIDFSRVDIVTSASFSGLIHLQELTNGTGCHLILCGLSPATRNLFDITGLTQVFEMCEGMSEAMVKLGANKSC
jgi:anti-anti-sigma factor